MTTPDQQPPPPQEGHPVFDAVLAALVAYFASREAIRAATLPPRLLALLAELGVPTAVARHAGQLALSLPMPGRHRVGTLPATPNSPLPRRVAAGEPQMRARYVVNAALRLAGAAREGRYKTALDAERRHLAGHLVAGRGRRAAARALEEATGGNPRLPLRWVSHLDDATCPVCRGLHGVIFTRDRLPDGHMPGAVHNHCRCEAVPALD